MGIRIIHGNQDLVGDAFRGLGEGADKLARQQNVDRELEDREARTAAYLQRIGDAKLLKQQELEIEQEALERETRRQGAVAQATAGLIGQEVAGMADNPFWSKDDEAEIRMLNRQLQQAGVTGKDYERTMDSWLEMKAGVLEERQLQNEKMQLADSIRRYATPGSSGVALLNPEEADLFLQQVESGRGLQGVRDSLRKTVNAAQTMISLERDMGEVSALVEQGQTMQGLSRDQKDRLKTIESNMIGGEKDYSPEESRLRVNSVLAGDGATLDLVMQERDELREFKRLVQQGGGRGDTPGGGVSDEDAVQPGNTLAQAVMQSDQPVAGVSQEDWLKANAYRKTYGDSAAGIVAGFLLTGQKNVVQKAIDEMRAATNDVPEDAPDSEVLAAAAHVAGKYGLKASPAELVALAGGMVHLGETPDGSPIQVPLDQYLEALKRKEEARKKQQDEDMGYGHPAFGPQPVMEGPDKGFDYYQEAAGSVVVKQSLGGAKR